MKITHKKITASIKNKRIKCGCSIKGSKKADVVASTSEQIPEPFDDYYVPISDEEISRMMGGYPAHPSPCEEVDGYDITNICYLTPKDEYYEALSDNSLDLVELISEDGGDPFVGFVAGGRIYPVSVDEVIHCVKSSNVEGTTCTSIDTSTHVKASVDDDFDNDMLYDRDEMAQAISDNLGVDITDAYIIYDWYDEEGALDDFDDVEDFLSWVEDDIYDMLDACDDQVTKNRILEAIEGGTDICGAIDTGMEYWYFSRHGLGPGTIPSGVQILDWYESGYDTWFKLDKLLTTEELQYYDIKESWPPKGAMTHNGDIIEAATAVKKSSCTKTDEDKDSIRYKVSSSENIEVEARSLANYKGYRLMSTPMNGWEVIDPSGKRLKTGLVTEDEARKFVDTSASTSIQCDDEVDEDADFMAQPDQEFKSDKTAVNGKQGKLPKVFKKAAIPEGALVLDYGGGTVESEQVAQDYLNQFNAVEMLYDPYNQTAEHNREIVKALRANGGADVAVCSNVLNVVKEEEVRLDIINKIKKLLKKGATAYISVYEGSKTGEGAGTQKGESYQNNRKLAGYLEEVQRVFPEAYKKGEVIIATKEDNGVAASTDTKASVDLGSLESDIWKGVIEYMTGPKGGFPEDEVKEYSFVDINEVDDDTTEVEVRAEISYDGMLALSEILDPIVEKYDSDAYFDMVAPGIMSAYIRSDGINASTTIEGAEHMDDYYFDEDLQDIYYDDAEDHSVEVFDKDVTVSFNFDFDAIVDQDESWVPEDYDQPYEDIEWPEENVVKEDKLKEDFEFILSWNIPTEKGKYNVKGSANLVYQFNDMTQTYFIDYSRSFVSNVKVTKLYDKSEDEVAEEDVKVEDVESSTDITAMMRPEEVEQAILDGKPFDLESFRNYWGEDPNEIKAKDIQVGDEIQTAYAEILDLGTVIKVTGIEEPLGNEKSYCETVVVGEVIEAPERITPSTQVGQIVRIPCDWNEGIGYKLN